LQCAQARERAKRASATAAHGASFVPTDRNTLCFLCLAHILLGEPVSPSPGYALNQPKSAAFIAP
jgi:hypothetical protein